MRPLILLLCLALTSYLPPLPLEGQALPGQARGISVGGSLDWFHFEGTGEMGITYRRTVLRRKAPGLDLGLSLFPRPLAQRALLLAADTGLAQAAPLGTSLLLLKGGVSAFLGVGNQFGVLVPGLHFGLGAIVPIDARSGVRLELIRHYYASERGPTVVWSLGVGFALLPRPDS